MSKMFARNTVDSERSTTACVLWAQQTAAVADFIQLPYFSITCEWTPNFEPKMNVNNTHGYSLY